MTQTHRPRRLTLTYYNDPGHGWLSVQRAWLHELGIADKISTYSYQRGNTVCLEEDCDASTFNAAARAAGWTLTFRDKHTDNHSRIRSYDHYSHTTQEAV